MSVSLTSRAATGAAPPVPVQAMDAISRFIQGLFIGAFILLLGFIAGVVTASLNPPPVETIVVPYDGCSTDSECEGV